MPGMRRREFVSLFGGAAASSPAWSRVAHAQQRTPTIGFLGVSTAASWTDWTAAFVSRLGELGWTDGRNVTIEYRWAGGLAERYPEIAAEFVRRKVDIIVTGGIAVPAAKQATSTIPIVFALAADPLAGSLVTSLARPGGNVTGLSAQSSGTASKRVEILREIIPSLRRIAVIGNAAYAASVEEIVRFRLWPAGLGSKSTGSKSTAPTISRLPSSGSRPGRRRCTCAPTRSPTPTAFASYPGAGRTIADDARLAGIRRSGWSHVVRAEHFGLVPPHSRVCRQNSARRETG
jgi:hypothetical protein